MSRHRVHATIALVALLFLAACGGATTPATSTPAPTAAASATLAPTATPDVTATTAATATAAASATPRPTASATPEPTLVPGTLGWLARGKLKDRPFAVMLDNHPDAYPQAGLDHAVLVFEALAEYGITRFMAVYADGISPDSEAIGPVRSSRIYFLYWALPFYPVYTHVGGSPDALSWLSGAGPERLLNFEANDDGSGYGETYAWRSANRPAPHNLFTSSELLRAFRTDFEAEEIELDFSQAGYLFRPAGPAPTTPEVARFGYHFISPNLPIAWNYDEERNGYTRRQWGQAHLDSLSGKQIWARSVVVLQVREEVIAGDPKGHIEQESIGEGPARLFAEGGVQSITWSKQANDAPLLFFDEQGQEIVFPQGPLWFAAVPDLDNLWY